MNISFWLSQVTVLQPPKGSLTLRVEGADVPLSPQPFALVVTGTFLISPVTCPAVALCPKACSGHGLCVTGRCECSAEYVGADCSQQCEILGCDENYTAMVHF